MSAKEEPNGKKAALRAVQLLVTAADGDTAFRDLYRQRATARLEEVMPELEYRALHGAQARIDVLLRQARAAVKGQDWTQVKELSDQVEGLRQTLRQKEAALGLAGGVYDADDVRVDPFSPGLARFALVPGETLTGLHQGLVTALRELAKADPPWNALYGERQRYFEQKTLPSEEATAEEASAETDLSTLRAQAQLAAERGDAASLRRLADLITQASAAARAKAPSPSAGPLPGVGGSVSAAVSTEPFPAECLERATALGFEHVQPKEVFAEMPALLSEFLARHAWQPGLPAQEAAQEGAIHLRDRLSRLDLPSELKEPMVELAALFALHPFINSGGVRYFGAKPGEYVLLETFPEDTEPPSDSEILSFLGLPHRHGLARVAIEEAFRQRGTAFLQERLGLDPHKFRIVCVPFDVYVRAGAERAWGGQPRWTHVDGYAVGRGGRLGALAAGHVRYGGLQDLVILGATDQRENVVARFCVVRRARFLPATG
jgi:hypothetical protein